MRPSNCPHGPKEWKVEHRQDGTKRNVCPHCRREAHRIYRAKVKANLPTHSRNTPWAVPHGVPIFHDLIRKAWHVPA